MNGVIIYGGAGFVGSALVKNLCEKKIPVAVIEKSGILGTLAYKRIENLPIEFIECDLENVDKLPKLVKQGVYDTFYQFAWNGLTGPELLDCNIQLNNVSLILESIKIAKKIGCKRFIGAGSVTQNEIFSTEGRLYQKDRHRYYRVAQMACELFGRSKAYEENIDFFWPRIINIYGPGETNPRLINNVITKLLDGEKIELSEGNQMYDFLYISDAAEAFYLIGKKGNPRVEYMIGSGNIKPLRDYLLEVKKIVNPEGIMQFGAIHFTGIYMQPEQLSIAELSNLGFVPQVTFKNGIKNLLNEKRK